MGDEQLPRRAVQGRDAAFFEDLVRCPACGIRACAVTQEGWVCNACLEAYDFKRPALHRAIFATLLAAIVFVSIVMWVK